MYQGKLVTFSEVRIDGDGNCGFSALGVDRADVVNVLLAVSDNAAVRQMIAPVIEQALMSEEHGIKFLLTDKWMRLKEQHAKTQQALGDIVRSINDAVFGDVDDKRMRQDDLTEWLFDAKEDDQYTEKAQKQFDEHHQKLVTAHVAFADAEADIKDFYEREDLTNYMCQMALAGHYGLITTALWLMRAR